MASDHDIFAGHGSSSGSSKTGRTKSVASELSRTGKTFDSSEGILLTIAQDQISKRFFCGVQMADAHDLANIFPIYFGPTPRGAQSRMELQGDEILRAREKHSLARQIHLRRSLDQPVPGCLLDEHEIERSRATLAWLELCKRCGSMVKPIPEIANEIEPARTILF